jgi:hypothetical protein
MMMIRETRRMDIDSKVFERNDLLNLARVIIDEFDKFKIKNEKSNFSPEKRFQINCSDKTSYDSQNPDLLEVGGIVDFKLIDSIRMNLKDYMTYSNIEISIIEGKGYGHWNGISVDGENRDWVNGVFNRLTECLNAVRPQNQQVQMITLLCVPFVAFGIAIIFWLIVGLIISSSLPFVNETASFQDMPFYITTYIKEAKSWLIYVFIFSLFIAHSIREDVLKLWPSVEFNIGPTHHNITAKRKRQIIGFISTFAVPIVIMIVYDIAKRIFL